MLPTSEYFNRGTVQINTLQCGGVIDGLKDTMAAGIRKAALSCVGKLTILWCACVTANAHDDSKGKPISLFEIFTFHYCNIIFIV